MILASYFSCTPYNRILVEWEQKQQLPISNVFDNQTNRHTVNVKVNFFHHEAPFFEWSLLIGRECQITNKVSLFIRPGMSLSMWPLHTIDLLELMTINRNIATFKDNFFCLNFL